MLGRVSPRTVRFISFLHVILLLARYSENQTHQIWTVAIQHHRLPLLPLHYDTNSSSSIELSRSSVTSLLPIYSRHGHYDVTPALEIEIIVVGGSLMIFSLAL